MPPNHLGRVHAALAELEAAVAELTAPDPVAELPLEDIVTTWGTLTCQRSGTLRFHWTMRVQDRGRSGPGTARVDLFSTGVRVTVTMNSKVFGSVDSCDFEKQVRTGIVTAMQTKPGWSAYRRHLVAEMARDHLNKLQTGISSVRIEADWLANADVWSRIATEADPAVARIAEQLYARGDFPGTTEDMFAAAAATVTG